MSQFVLVCIVGSGDRSIEQAMIIVEKGYSNADHTKILRLAGEAGVDNAEIVGEVDIPNHIAESMGDWRIYVG